MTRFTAKGRGRKPGRWTCRRGRPRGPQRLATYERLERSLADDDAWKAEIPGKALVAKFANRAGVSPGRAKSMYLNAVHSSGRDTFAEVALFERFAA
jgi:hypothetical protein